MKEQTLIRFHKVAEKGTFRYKVIGPLIGIHYLCIKIHILPMIPEIRYSLAEKQRKHAAGIADLSRSRGLLIDTNGCTVLLVHAGCAVAEINFRRRALRRGDAVFLFYDDVFVLRQRSALFSVHFVSIANETVEPVFYKLTSPSFWDFLYENPVMGINREQRSLLEGWMQQIEWIIGTGESPYEDELLGNGMMNLFMAVHTEIIRSGNEPISTGRNRSWLLAMKFWKLLGKYGKERRSVQFYASKLCITTTYLYKLTQKEMQASPKELIDQQILSQMKTYLANTDYSIGEIAVQLHFGDASYFCRFFRRMTGLSPLEFRNGLKK